VTKIAPHLVRQINQLIPLYKKGPNRLKLRLGIRIYNLFVSRSIYPKARFLSREQFLDLEPNVKKEGLEGGIVYIDGFAPFVERLCVENAISASELGAKIFTHTEVTKLDISNNKLEGIELLKSNGETIKIHTKWVINASGPWLDEVLNNVHSKKREERLEKSKGVQIVTQEISKNSLFLGSRILIIPWMGKSIVGATDTKYFGAIDDVKAEKEDIDGLIKILSEELPNEKIDGIFTFAGVRPLTKVSRPAFLRGHRPFKIFDHKKEDGIEGLISVGGGRVTNHLKVSRCVVDYLSKRMNIRKANNYGGESRPKGSHIRDLDITKLIKERYPDIDVTNEQVIQLFSTYGSRIYDILDLIVENKQLGEKICNNNPDVKAQINYAVKNEFAKSISDFMLRRSAIGYSDCRGLDCCGEVGKIMGQLLNWDESWINKEIEEYKRFIHSSQL